MSAYGPPHEERAAYGRPREGRAAYEPPHEEPPTYEPPHEEAAAYGPPHEEPAPAGDATLLVIAKEPRPGRVKTRLTPAYTPVEAARLAAAALADTLRAVRRLPARRRVLVLEGRPGAWLPAGFDVVPQCGGGLDERLAAAFGAYDDGPALLVGMDTPQLGAAALAPALAPDAWSAYDACLGPAADGGFWALGLAAPDPALLRGVPMSTPHTGAAQRERLAAAGLRVRDLPVLRDVDTPGDVATVAAAADGGEFARVARALGPRDGSARPAVPR